MKKITLLIIMLMVMTACTQEYPGEYRLVCESNFENHELDYLMEENNEIKFDWNEHSVFYSVDNYIVKSETITTVPMNEEAINYLKSKFKGNEEEFLEEVMNIFRRNDFQSVRNADEVDIRYIDDSIVMHIYNHSPKRPEGWKGLIVPEKHDFLKAIETLQSYQDNCKVIKD